MQASPTQFGIITASFIMRDLYKMRNLDVKRHFDDSNEKLNPAGKFYQIQTVRLIRTPRPSRSDDGVSSLKPIGIR